MDKESRSVQRRIAAQKGEPTPEFDKPSTTNREAVAQKIAVNTLGKPWCSLNEQEQDYMLWLADEILSLIEPNCEKCEVMLSAMNVHPKTIEPKVLSEVAKIGLDLVNTVLYEHPDDAIAQAQKQVLVKALATIEGE